MSQDSLVFVSCADSGDVHVLRLNAAQGTLDTVQVLALGGTLMPMALSPDLFFFKQKTAYEIGM